MYEVVEKKLTNTVKPVHAVTSIKQSSALKGHLVPVMSYKISYELNLFLEVTCLIRPLSLCPKGLIVLSLMRHTSLRETKKT